LKVGEKDEKITSSFHRILMGHDWGSSDLTGYPLLPYGLHCSDSLHLHVDCLSYFSSIFSCVQNTMPHFAIF